MRISAAVLAIVLAVSPALAGEAKIPDGFVAQALDGTGGTVMMPKGWFYRMKDSAAERRWTFSQENPDTDRVQWYETGLLIETFKLVPTPTPEQMAEKFVRGKRSELGNVQDCAAPDLKGAGKSCVEGEKEVAGTTYHMRYIFYWNNDTKLLVACTFRTPVGNWPQAKATAEVMLHYDLGNIAP